MIAAMSQTSYFYKTGHNRIEAPVVVIVGKNLA